MKKLAIFFESLNGRFWNRVYTNVRLPEKSFPVLRIFISFFLLICFFTSYSWVTDFPDLLYTPPAVSIGLFFKGFPPKPFFIVLCGLMLICNLCMILGIKSRLSGIGYVVCCVIGNTFVASFNKIEHNTLFLIPVFLLSFSNWGTDLALLPDRYRANRDANRYLGISALFLILAFFSAGYPKFLEWVNLDWKKNGMGAWFYPRYFREKESYLLANFVFDHFPFWSFKILDYIAVLFELTPVFFLLKSKRTWQSWVILACSFHMMNTLLLNIGRFISLGAFYTIYFDFSIFYDPLKRLFAKKSVLIAAAALLSVLATIRVFQFVRGIPSKIIFVPDYATKAYLTAEIGIWLMIIALAVFLSFKKTSRFGS